MDLFGKKSKAKLLRLSQENKMLKRRVKNLEGLCAEKDSFFMELMSDGLRHGSPLAAKHMSDRKKFKHGR
ncbi:MAG: hypothetical protein HFF98_10885 [Oscillibacter sp.]|nr:hypothetical protein [Oscillibacter sp.]